MSQKMHSARVVQYQHLHAANLTGLQTTKDVSTQVDWVPVKNIHPWKNVAFGMLSLLYSK